MTNSFLHPEQIHGVVQSELGLKMGEEKRRCSKEAGGKEEGGGYVPTGMTV